MLQLHGRKFALYLVAAIAVLYIGLKYVSSNREADSAIGNRSPVVVNKQDAALRVYVSGAVRRVGVYKVHASARVVDALKKAGGATSSADLNAVNLAAKLQDGQQIVVPKTQKQGSQSMGLQAADDRAEKTVSLNAATQEQLETLDGVGPATAKKIVEHRQKHGGFGSVEDLLEITGIGEKKLEALRDSVRP